MSSGKRCPERNCEYCVQGKAKRHARRADRHASREALLAELEAALDELVTAVENTAKDKRA